MPSGLRSSVGDAVVSVVMAGVEISPVDVEPVPRLSKYVGCPSKDTVSNIDGELADTITRLGHGHQLTAIKSLL